MEHVSKSLASTKPQNGSDSGPSRETRRRAAVAWEGLKQIFGTSFLTLYGDTPNTLWLRKIAELTDEQVNTGLRRVADMERDYPVNLTEFKEACNPTSPGRRFHGRPTTPRALEHQRGEPASREHIDSCLASIRRKLGSRSREPGEDDETPERKPRLDDACTCPLDEPGTCEVCRKFAAYLGGA